ncbi:MAG: CAP domain-containing protein [Methanoregula sp.]|nr:MAG: CAP domain-containing protein [Methanoregula sp.]
MPHCDNCGAYTYLPFSCSYCGGNYCGKCRLPPNHRCINLDRWEGKPRPPYPTRRWDNSERHHRTKRRHYPETNHKESETQHEEREETHEKRNTRKKVHIRIQNLLNLKNLTILSIILISIGLFSQQYLTTQYAEIFKDVIVVGVLGLIIAYFIYALKCWGANSQISAVLMITIPLLAYFFSTTKIPVSTNIAVYILIQFCYYAIISVIFLFVCNKIKVGFDRYISKSKSHTHWYFLPNTTYSLLGIVLISFLLVNYGSISLFSDNTATITHSLQHINTPSHTTPNANVPLPTTTVQNPQIIPTLQPEIVKNIENSANSVMPSPPTIDQQTLERRVHELINQQRKGQGLSLLSFDQTLAGIARKHSEDMAKNNYFSHDNLRGLGPTERGNQVGYSCYKNYGSYYTTGIAENIFQNNLYTSTTYYNGIPVHAWSSLEEIAQSTVNGWMTSPGHRRNILTSTYDREGIGVAISADDKVYITEDFC